jgi:hypothetical protein
MTAVLSAREAAVFGRFAETVLAPAPPLPPVRRTDAVQAFDAWLASSPRLNRIGMRAALLGLEATMRLSRRERLAVLQRLERHGGRPLVEALRAAAALSYYGDPEVSALLGYDPR